MRGGRVAEFVVHGDGVGPGHGLGWGGEGAVSASSVLVGGWRVGGLERRERRGDGGVGRDTRI